MSILIKGLDMPEDGMIGVFISSDGNVYDSIDDIVGTIVPVPPHGRLIDADAAIRQGWTISRNYSASPTENVYEIKTLDALPTIIEAEEGE